MPGSSACVSANGAGEVDLHHLAATRSSGYSARGRARPSRLALLTSASTRPEHRQGLGGGGVDGLRSAQVQGDAGAPSAPRSRSRARVPVEARERRSRSPPPARPPRRSPRPGRARAPVRRRSPRTRAPGEPPYGSGPGHYSSWCGVCRGGSGTAGVVWYGNGVAVGARARHRRDVRRDVARRPGPSPGCAASAAGRSGSSAATTPLNCSSLMPTCARGAERVVQVGADVRRRGAGGSASVWQLEQRLLKVVLPAARSAGSPPPPQPRQRRGPRRAERDRRERRARTGAGDGAHRM